MHFSNTESEVHSISSFAVWPSSSPSQASHQFLLFYFQNPHFPSDTNMGHCIDQLLTFIAQRILFPVFAY